MGKRSFLLFALTILLFSGCGRKEEKVADSDDSTQTKETRIVIPPEVEGKWKAVRIAVLDKEKSKEEVYTVDLGYEFAIPEAGLSVKVQNFLPAFIMEGTVLTSQSNDPRNPAVQIIIRQQGQELFKGWLFSLYPGTHGYQHPRYSFSLVEFIPAKKS